MQNKNKQIAFWILFAFGGLLFYWLKEYITPFLGAIIFFVLLRTPMHYLVEKRKWKHGLASGVLILLTLILIVLPSFFLFQYLFSQVSVILQNSSSLLAVFEQIENLFRQWFKVELLSDKNLNYLVSQASNILPGFLSESFVAIGNLVLMCFILYYLLKSYQLIGPSIQSFLPISQDHLKTFEKELQQMTISNVIVGPLLALLQTIVAAVGYKILGVEYSFLWAIFTGLFSFIPFVGSALIWAPAALIAFSQGQQQQAIYLLLFGIMIISNVDNIFRFVLQKKLADVHPLITVLGVLFGVPVFGLPGFIFGPLMISYFVIGLKLYKASYIKDNNAQLFND